MKTKLSSCVALVAVSMLLASCVTVDVHEQSSSNDYRAEIIRTSYGIPHITADDYGSIGYGEGYAAAQDHICNIADAIVTARGEQALHFGPGDKNAHVMSDIVIQALDIPNRAYALFQQEDAQTQEWLNGYAAGYNRYIRETGVGGITSWCKDGSYVREITGADVFLRITSTAQTVPRMAAMVAGAQPPTAETAAMDVAPELYAQAEAGMQMDGMGSNGWAFGSELTENGRGLLLGNPHYPWYGTNRFWEKHLTVPGEMDVYGSGLVGTPGVAIGFNKNVGWTHTVSNSQRLVLYKLDLVPGDPTSYLVDGEPRKMISKTVTVQINAGDGQIVPKEHTVWFSHHGPMVVMPGLEWTEEMAFTIRDANAENFVAFHQWKDMGTAENMDAFKAAHAKWNAMPWVNSIATSSDGRAVYLDGSNVANLSAEAIGIWAEQVKSDPMVKSVFEKNRMMLLNGSDSRFDFQEHPDSVVPGVVPFAQKPQLDRTDFVFNSNDSYWLSNPSAPLTGYSPLYGPVNFPRSPRTRVNAIMLSDTSPGGHYGDDGRMTLHEMQDALFSNRSLSAELLRDELVAALAGVDSVKVGEKMVNISAARDVIAGYNGKLDLDSKGAILFREWITGYKTADFLTKGNLFAVPFDPADPINTPRGLGDAKVAAEKVGQAVLNLQAAGLTLDSTLADAQFSDRYGTPIALHGGNSQEGVANLMVARGVDLRTYDLGTTKIEGSATLTDKGYTIVHGSSFILCLSYTDNGPVAEALLTYSQSGDPTSVHFMDQTKMYAAKQWRPVLFNRDDIEANTESVTILTGPR